MPGSNNIKTNSVESTAVQKSMNLVFNAYNGHYFLAQIWNEGDNIGRELNKSPAEIEMADKYSPGQQIALRTGVKCIGPLHSPDSRSHRAEICTWFRKSR